MIKIAQGGSKAANEGAHNPASEIVALIEGPDGASEPIERESMSPRCWGFDVAEINRSYALAIWGGKAVVVNEQPAGPINDRIRVMSFESMNSWFANRHTEIVGSDGKIKSVTWAKAWHQHPDRRQYDGVEFFPNPDGAPSTPKYLNLWRGFSVAPSPTGTWRLFEDHLRVNVCRENPGLYRYLIGWMAHLVQKPRERPGIALVLRGKKGTGKTKVGEVLGSMMAAHYFPVDDARYLTGQFNAHMSSCLLLQADEATWAGDKAGEGRLKGLITSRIQMIESKGVDPIRMENRVRVIMTSNEDWVVPATGDERRFFVLDIGSAAQRNNQYFAEMDEELSEGGHARLLHDLLAFDLSTFDIFAIPQTKALLDQKLRSLEPIDDFLFNKLYDGSDWPARVVCDDLYAEYVRTASQIGINRKRSPSEFGKRLAKLVPNMRKVRPAIECERGITKRMWCYEMPPLGECREAFDQSMGQPIDWPALSPGAGERAVHTPSDDIVPF